MFARVVCAAASAVPSVRRCRSVALGLVVSGCIAGCISGSGEGEKDGDTSSGESELEEDDGGVDFDGDGPVISNVGLSRTDACYLTADYDDPQGPADVRRGEVAAVEPASGETVWTDMLFVCQDYECVGSFRDQPEYVPATCSRIEGYELYAQLFDRDGNPSDRVPVPMR